MEIGKIRENVQNQISWKRVQNVFRIGKLEDGRDIYGINGNNNQMFGCAIVSDVKGIELIF